MKLSLKVLFIIQWIIFSLLIFYFSSLTRVELLPESLLNKDKLLHLSGFFLYGLSIQLFVITISKASKFKQMLFVLLIGSIYAMSDELHQSFVPGRMPDIFDFIVDVIGIILSLFLFNLILKALDKSKKSKDAKIS